MPTLENEKPYLSWSQASQYLKCAEQYRLQRIAKAIPSWGRNGAAFCGQLAHKALEHNYLQKINSGNDLKPDDVADHFATLFDAEPDLAEIQWIGETAETARENTIRALKTHVEKLAPSIQPRAVEQRVRVKLGADIPFDLLAILDLVTTDNRVIDAKFYGRMKSQADVDSDGQMTLYALAYLYEYDDVPTELALAISTRTHTPSAKMLSTRRTWEQINWQLENQLKPVFRGIAAGVFPARDDGWWCSQKWCAFYEQCKGRRD